MNSAPLYHGAMYFLHDGRQDVLASDPSAGPPILCKVMSQLYVDSIFP